MKQQGNNISTLNEYNSAVCVLQYPITEHTNIHTYIYAYMPQQCNGSREQDMYVTNDTLLEQNITIGAVCTVKSSWGNTEGCCKLMLYQILSIYITQGMDQLIQVYKLDSSIFYWFFLSTSRATSLRRVNGSVKGGLYCNHESHHWHDSSDNG